MFLRHEKAGFHKMSDHILTLKKGKILSQHLKMVGTGLDPHRVFSLRKVFSSQK